MLRIALRAHRTGFLVTALLSSVTMFVEAAGFAAAAGQTPAQRAVFGQQMEALAPQVAYLIPLPIHPETLGGYVQWRGFGFVYIITSFWALMAATGAIRNEEERGLIEQWMASTVGRLRLVAARCAAFTVAAAGVVFLTALGAFAGAAAASGSLDMGGVLEVSLALLGVTVASFGVGLLAAQLIATRRGASALGGVVLLALFFLDSLSRVKSSLESWSRISPFHLYNRTTAVAPGGRFDLEATVALFVAAAILAVLSTYAFSVRDVGASLFRRRHRSAAAVRTPSGNPLLRLPVLSALYEQRWILVSWAIGTMLLAAFILSLARSTADLLRSNPTFQAYLQAGFGSDPNLVLLALFWFGFAAFIVAAYAISQVARWAADDAEGRLEMTIAQPVSRSRVVLERSLTLLAASTVIAGLGSLVVAAGAPAQDIHPDSGRLLLATVLLVPVALAFGGLGATIIARWPRLAVPVLSLVAVAGYLIQQVGPLFKWPSWALDLSVFTLYGTPLTTGVFWTGLWAMVAVTVLGFGIGLVAMRYRDVAS